MTKKFLIAFFAVFISQISQSATAATLEENLIRQLDLFAISPCASTLHFAKPEDQWIVSCPNCAAISAVGFYSDFILQKAEEHSIDNKISFTRIMQISGTCQ